MESEHDQFPQGFLWGAATASYQVEGAEAEDGRGPSIWDVFSRTPGRVKMDHTGAVACDQYHRYQEDVQLMKWLGLRAYRFSVSWPRVVPAGSGSVNPAGLDYYDRLVDELIAHGIEPWVTLFHWDLPNALQESQQGWQSRDTPYRFAEYVGHVTEKLSDRVRNFFTVNEMHCFSDIGHSGGEHAPGLTLDDKQRNQVRHHALLAHGLAVQAIRALAKQDVRVGLAENPSICVPVIETEEHIAAARTAMRELNGPFLTPVLEGAYPQSYSDSEGANMPRIENGDMELIGAPLDFVGLNMYAPCYVRADEGADSGYAVVSHPDAYPRMHMPWLYIGPRITYWGPRHLSEIWGVRDVYITENRCAADDHPAEDGEVYDTDRVMYLRAHFQSAQQATREGWPLRGYFVWSLLDNFEWAWGYTRRFGITYVNYETLERTPKLNYQLTNGTLNLFSTNPPAMWVTGSGQTHTLDCDVTHTDVKLAADVVAGSTLVVNGSITGAFQVSKAGAGTLRLGGANDYTGRTAVSAGTLVLNHSLAAGDNPIGLTAGVTIGFGDGVDVTNNINVPGALGAVTFDVASGVATQSGIIGVGAAASVAPPTPRTDGPPNVPASGAVLTKTGSGELYATGSNTFETINLSGGTYTLGNSGAAPLIAIDTTSAGATLGYADGVTNPRSQFMTFPGNLNVDAGRAVQGASIAGIAQGTVTKTGSGTLELLAGSSYPGEAIVEAGTMLINANGATGSGSITVKDGGTLGGTGLVNTTANVEAGGTLAPGVSPGVLSVAQVGRL